MLCEKEKMARKAAEKEVSSGKLSQKVGNGLPNGTPLEKRFMEVYHQIQQQRQPSAHQQALVARELVQVTLPHTDPGNVPVWQRSNGTLTLSMRPGWDHQHQRPLGYPYGTLPRLLLMWITTEVHHTQQRKLFLGSSLAAFMRELDLDPSRGGQRSDAYRLREQMERLFRALITLEYRQTTPDAGSKYWFDMQIAPQGELWWQLQPKANTAPDEPLWQSWIELSETFFNALATTPVTVDTRAVHAFKHSPLALDLYAWVMYRVYQAGQADQPDFISWQSLLAATGAEYNDPKNFSKKAKEIFSRLQLLYPDLKIEFPTGGLRIFPAHLKPSLPLPIKKTAPPLAQTLF